MDIEINDIAKFGAVADVPAYQLPPEIWNFAQNMRSLDMGMEKLLGWEAIFGTPTTAPQFVMPISTVAANFWVYLGLTKAYVYDGTNHIDITRAAGDYTVTNGRDWNGTVLGGVPVFNNGVDVPQFWADVDTGTDLANLTNWPATHRAKIMRAHGPFLMAFGITESGDSFPHRVMWSHPADPGTVPTSWDVTDETVDAGEVDLSDVNSGIIQDALALGNATFIYKETSTWRVRYVGGRSVFDFGEAPWLPTLGLLAPRCVALTGDGLRHVLATQDDIVWHNGNTVRSILNNRQRKRLAAEIDSSNYVNSFMFTNPLYNEMWFCYPTSGNEFPDAALILNYSDPENWVVTEANGITFRHAAVGLIESPNDEEWEDNPNEEWDEDTGPWSEVQRRRVVLAGTAATKLYNLDKGTTRDTVEFSGTLRREGLSVLGRKRSGEWIVDHQIRKLFQRLWPKVQGGPISVRTGASETVNGGVSWGASTAFDPATEVTADVPPVSGRALSVEFSGSESWRIDGYKMQLEKLGQF